MYIYISNAKNPEPTQNRAEAMGTCLSFWDFLRGHELWICGQPNGPGVKLWGVEGLSFWGFHSRFRPEIVLHVKGTPVRVYRVTLRSVSSPGQDVVTILSNQALLPKSTPAAWV